MKLFDIAVTAAGEPVSIDQLASGVGADPLLVSKCTQSILDSDWI
jgi:hypothetical protein